MLLRLSMECGWTGSRWSLRNSPQPSTRVGLSSNRQQIPIPWRSCSQAVARVVPGEQQAAALADETIPDACAKAEVPFVGVRRAHQRDSRGRLYIHIDDYRTWSERKAGGDLEVTEGVLTASWNASVEAKGDYPELAGHPRVQASSRFFPDEDDFFSCKNFLGASARGESRGHR